MDLQSTERLEHIMREVEGLSRFTSGKTSLLTSVRGSYAQGLALQGSDVDIQLYTVGSLVDVMLSKTHKNKSASVGPNIDYQDKNFKELTMMFLKPNMDTAQVLWGQSLKSEHAQRTQNWLLKHGLSTLALNYDKLAFSVLGQSNRYREGRLHLTLYNVLAALEVEELYKKKQTEEQLLMKLQDGKALTDKVDLLAVKQGNEQAEAELLLSSLLEQLEHSAHKGLKNRTKREEELRSRVAQLEELMALDLLDFMNYKRGV